MIKAKYTNPYEVSVEQIISRPNHIFMALVSAVMILGTLLVLAWAGYQDSHYKTTATVYSVDASGTIFVDGAGYLWEVYDTDYTKGSFVEIEFNNNRTDYTRNDDKIINVKVLDD